MIPLFLLTQTAAPPAPAAPADAGWCASVVSTSAFGLTHGKFFNQLAGARLDYRFTPRLALGAALSYANLEGKDRRAHQVLPELAGEYRLTFASPTVALPLRLSLGYLPKNGPAWRLGAGFDLALSRSVTLELLALEPMVWVTRDRAELSLNASVALGVAF